MSVTDNHTLPFITYTPEVLILPYNKLEFWAWLDRHPVYKRMRFEETSEGAILNIGFTRIDIGYSPIPTPKGYEYVFEITDLEGHPNIGKKFIDTVRNISNIPIEEKKEVGKAEKANLYMPKKTETLQHNKKAWKIYKVMCKEYEQEVKEGRSNEPQPSIEDLRVRVIDEMKWKVGGKTLETVLRKGKAGMLG